MPTTYLAITTGPIIKTLNNTRKTRELWGASYLFSVLMREITSQLIKGGIIMPNNILQTHTNLWDWQNDTWNTVQLTSDGISKLTESGCGIFPDRLVAGVEQSNITRQTIQNHIDTALNDITAKYFVDSNDAKQFAKNYFQVYFILQEISDDENIMQVTAALLDTLELQSNYSLEEGTNYLSEFLKDIPARGIVEDAFGNAARPVWGNNELYRKGFESIVEISTRELSILPDTKAFYEAYLAVHLEWGEVLELSHGNTNTIFQKTKDGTGKPLYKAIRDEYEQLLKKYDNQLKKREIRERVGDESLFVKHLKSACDAVGPNDPFRTYHKYIAIVQADGDNIGKIIGKIGNNPEKVKHFSEILTRFSAWAALEVKKYGGTPVFAGGDDLLFFAPVSMVQVERIDAPGGYLHLFDLLHKLDNEFKNQLTAYKDFLPSLSFGVSITFYKHPMGEALIAAREMLFGKAKLSKTKNAIAVNMLKHSGSQFGGLWNLTNPSFKTLLGLLGPQSDQPKIDAVEILKSVVYKLDENEHLLQIIAIDPAMVENFITNNFNETVHRVKGKDGNKELIPYLKHIVDLIPMVKTETHKEWQHLKNTQPDFKETESSYFINQLYGLLRALSFVKGEKDER